VLPDITKVALLAESVMVEAGLAEAEAAIAALSTATGKRIAKRRFKRNPPGLIGLAE